MADYWWTPYVAAYAAVLSTAALVWNAVRDLNDRRKSVAVTVDCVSDGQAWIRVTNFSRQGRVQIRGVFGRTAAGQSMGFCMETPELPLLLSPSESVDFDIPKTVNFLNAVETIGIVDGTGEEHCASKSAVKKAKAIFTAYEDVMRR